MHANHIPSGGERGGGGEKKTQGQGEESRLPRTGKLTRMPEETLRVERGSCGSNREPQKRQLLMQFSEQAGSKY